MELTLTLRGSGAVGFRSQLVHQEHRKPVLPRVGSKENAGDFLRICSWCRRAVVDRDTCIEIEEAIVRAQVFVRDDLPELTHTSLESAQAVGILFDCD